ncbi:MAG: ATP phosphoribosyltransferase [Pseudomonadota bacterium]
MTTRDRLRIAMQKSGRLTEPSQALLAQCGLKFRVSRDKLFCYGETLPVDLLLVRDDDIPGMIAQGVADLGFVGRNVLAEQAGELARDPALAPLAEIRALGFGGCRLSIAVPNEDRYESPADLAGQRIATSYPNLLRQWLAAHGVEASVVMLNGSVEIAPRLGTADSICDLVSSGGTLAANQLREVATILQSEAVLAGTATPPADARGEFLDLLLRRLDGVLAVKDSKLVMLHAPRHAVEAIARLLPGDARPSVMPLEGSDDVALQAVCRGAVTWNHLEAMKAAGARSLLVLPVEKMLA